MATVSIQKTKNIRASIDYVLGENDERVKWRSGHNLNPYDAKFEMRNHQFKNNKQEGFIQAYTILQSFPEDDFVGMEPLEIKQKVNQVGLETARKLYPDTQILVVTHDDGESQLYHNHIIVNSVQLDGRSIRENRGFQKVALETNAVCRTHGLSVLNHEKSYVKENGETVRYIDFMTEKSTPQSHHWMKKRNELTDYEKLQKMIDDVKQTAKNKDEFKTLMYEVHNVDVNFRVRNGQDTVSYKALDEDMSKKMKRRISGKKLGSEYDFESLIQSFNNNIEKEREKEKISVLVDDISTERTENTTVYYSSEEERLKTDNAFKEILSQPKSLENYLKFLKNHLDMPLEEQKYIVSQRPDVTVIKPPKEWIKHQGYTKKGAKSITVPYTDGTVKKVYDIADTTISPYDELAFEYRSPVFRPNQDKHEQKMSDIQFKWVTDYFEKHRESNLTDEISGYITREYHYIDYDSVDINKNSKIKQEKFNRWNQAFKNNTTQINHILNEVVHKSKKLIAQTNYYANKHKAAVEKEYEELQKNIYRHSRSMEME